MAVLLPGDDDGGDDDEEDEDEDEDKLHPLHQVLIMAVISTEFLFKFKFLTISKFKIKFMEKVCVNRTIAHISQLRHPQRWCTFFKAVYFFPQGTRKRLL